MSAGTPLGRMLTHHSDGTPKSLDELVETFFEQSSENARAQLTSAIQVGVTRQLAAATLRLEQAIDRAAAASARHEAQLVWATRFLVLATVALVAATIFLALKQ